MPIPKIIHYFYDDIDIWRKGTHSTFRMCYKSWLEKCSDYQIKLWHDKMPEFQEMLYKSKFLRECYKRRMWAFVADYVRYYALYNYGGIYIDTDVELLKNFDKYLDNPFFCSIEGDILNGENIPEPAVMGGEKNHQVFKSVLDLYNSDEIFKVDYFIANIILKKIITELTDFSKIDYNSEFKEKSEKYYDKNVWTKVIKDIDVYKNQRIYIDQKSGIYIYPSEYFCPTWASFGLKAFTDKTVSIHWNQSSWWKDYKSQKLKEIQSLRYVSAIRRYAYMNNRRVARWLTCLIPSKRIRREERAKLERELGT